MKKLIRLHLFVYPSWWLEIFNSRCPNFPQYIDFFFFFRRKCNYWCLLTVFLQTYFWGPIYPALCFLFNSSRGWLSIYTDEPWIGLKSTCLIDLEFRFIGFSNDAKDFHNCATWISNLVYNTRFSSSKAKSIESLLTDILDLIDRATPYESGEQMGINWSKDWSKRWLVITYLGKRPGGWL